MVRLRKSYKSEKGLNKSPEIGRCVTATRHAERAAAIQQQAVAWHPVATIGTTQNGKGCAAQPGSVKLCTVR